MNNNITKLLEIASEQINNTYFNTAQEWINEIYQYKNGFYAFENALHFFSNLELEKINTLIHQKKLYDSNCIYFAEDIFGNLFCEKINKFYFLDVEIGELELMGNSIEEWAKKIITEYNYYTGYSLGHEWQIKNGKLSTGQRLIPKKLFILGGKYTLDNLISQNTIEALKFRSNIAHQLSDVKDGEKIIIEVK